MDRRTFLKWNTAGLGALALSPLMGACASDDKKSSGGPRIALSHPGAAAGIVAVVAEIARKRTVQLGGSFTIGAMANPFQRTRHDISLWRALAAPALGGAGLLTAVALALQNWSVLVGTDSGLPRFLPLLVPLVLLVGALLRTTSAASEEAAR